MRSVLRRPKEPEKEFIRLWLRLQVTLPVLVLVLFNLNWSFFAKILSNLSLPLSFFRCFLSKCPLKLKPSKGLSSTSPTIFSFHWKAWNVFWQIVHSIFNFNKSIVSGGLYNFRLFPCDRFQSSPFEEIVPPIFLIRNSNFWSSRMFQMGNAFRWLNDLFSVWSDQSAIFPKSQISEKI
jgi:hypothetical protein